MPWNEWEIPHLFLSSHCCMSEPAFFPCPAGETEDAETEHRRMQYLCLLRTWEGSWLPIYSGRSTTAHPTSGTKKDQSSRLEMGIHCSSTQAALEGNLLGGGRHPVMRWQARFKKRTVDRHPVGLVLSIHLWQSPFIYHGLIPIVSTNVLY